MPVAHIMQGLPASGKSTFARTLTEQGVWRFNMDDYRDMMGLRHDTWTKERENIVFEAMIEGIRSAIKAGHDVVIDNTHLTPGWCKRYRKEFAREGVTFLVHSFIDVPIEECIRRDNGRPDKEYVGEDVIVKLHSNYVKASANGWKLTERWMNPEPYAAPVPVGDTDHLPMAIICDIDGTVADHTGVRSPYDYSKVHLDAVRENVAILVALAKGWGVRILFVSGRESGCREETLAWLKGAELYDGHLYMREEGDKRPDYIVKNELFDRHIRDNWDVWFVLDDRDQVVRLWRDLGLDCFQVNYGDF